MNLEQIEELQRNWHKFSTQQQRELRRELEALEFKLSEWKPLPGPQEQALNSKADVILFGGAAGGGKSFLALGKALRDHQRVLILREEFPQLAGLIETSKTVYGPYGKFRESPQPQWRLNYNGVNKLIEFGACKLPDDWKKYMGRAHDLRVLDEASNFLERSVIMLANWIRSEDPNQKCQLLLVSNPPASSDGQWLFEWFKPWLDKKHPNPAKPGELRYFARVNDKDTEVEFNKPFIIKDKEIIYDFDPADHDLEDIIIPKSRTFIPSRVTDNPYYVKSGYIGTLQALQEPLRSMYLKGDFMAGQQDDAWQIIPTAWVKAAMDRWERTPKPQQLMETLGVDVARGGRDNTILSPRYGLYYDKQIAYPGTLTPDGATVAGQVMANRQHYTQVNIDIVGIGTSAYDILNSYGIPIDGICGASKSEATDLTGFLGFVNRRAELYWKFRELLDPVNENEVCLPPDSNLLADLTTPRWKLASGKIQVESKEDIIKRLGRSPDWGDSIIYASAPKSSGFVFSTI